ncbi:MAG TPA: hypothetical protein VFB54_12920 [Burkholderiales bacterium]|nr:hypothetical protein [Burkholderiales bacterium]
MLTFVGLWSLWSLTGTMERIPPQSLMLLGISAATGLGAVVIGLSKTSALQNEIDPLLQEKRKLEEENARNNGVLSPENLSKLASIEDKLKQLQPQLDVKPSQGFWRDICNDGNGLSFHRLQIVLWTFVLGAVFVRAVADAMSMPEFSETLLTPMGISNATYLGFKIPEK